LDEECGHAGTGVGVDAEEDALAGRKIIGEGRHQGAVEFVDVGELLLDGPPMRVEYQSGEIHSSSFFS
jgi:hypothetical protein